MFSMCFGCCTQDQEEKNPKILIQQATIKEIQITIPKPPSHHSQPNKHSIAYESAQQKKAQPTTDTDNSSATTFNSLSYDLMMSCAQNNDHHHKPHRNDGSSSTMGDTSSYFYSGE